MADVLTHVMVGFIIGTLLSVRDDWLASRARHARDDRCALARYFANRPRDLDRAASHAGPRATLGREPRWAGSRRLRATKRLDRRRGEQFDEMRVLFAEP